MAALRVEWAKSKARAHRWWEEVVLLDEEMRRVIVYGRQKARNWENDALSRARISEVNDVLAEGISAYTYEHAVMEEQMADELEEKWAKTRARTALIKNGDMEAAEVAEHWLVASGEVVHVEVILEDDEGIAPADEDEY